MGILVFYGFCLIAAIRKYSNLVSIFEIMNFSSFALGFSIFRVSM